MTIGKFPKRNPVRHITVLLKISQQIVICFFFLLDFRIYTIYIVQELWSIMACYLISNWYKRRLLIVSSKYGHVPFNPPSHYLYVGTNLILDGIDQNYKPIYWYHFMLYKSTYTHNTHWLLLHIHKHFLQGVREGVDYRNASLLKMTWN